MRIRKHAKISQLLHTASFNTPPTLLQTYVCQLNQSPWDVISFSPSPPPPTLVNGEDGCGGIRNGGSGRRTSAGERKVRNDEKVGDSIIDKKVKVEEEGLQLQLQASKGKNGKVIMCCKSDGKSWHCPREAAAGSSLCIHHLSLQAKNYNGATKSNQPRRRSSRSRPNKLGLSASSDTKNEFYYYSGFRPGWSSRIKINGINGYAAAMPKKLCDNERDDSAMALWPQEEEEDGDDDEVDYSSDSEEDSNNNRKRKRVRKPIKARSLKSLM